MRDVSELYLRHLQPSTDLQTVAQFEAHFGITLPADYLCFMSAANGGEPMLDCTFGYTMTSGMFLEDADQVKEFYSLTDDTQVWNGVWKNTDFLREVFREIGRDTDVVCIGATGEGDLIYLDFATLSACVRILYRDFDDMTPKIAASFEEFLDSLHPRR